MSKALRVFNGELYIYGNLISRNLERPWLFNITDAYLACEKQIKKDAAKSGKDTELTFNSKSPKYWFKKNVKENTFNSTSKHVLRRLAKHGLHCGFGTSANFNPRTDSLDTEALVSSCELSNKELCVHIVYNKDNKTHDIFVCQDFVIEYVSCLSLDIQEEIIDTVISIINGYTKEVTRKVRKNEALARPLR